MLSFFYIVFVVYACTGDSDDEDKAVKVKKATNSSVTNSNGFVTFQKGGGEGDEEVVEEEVTEEDMMAALGFSGFNTTKVSPQKHT